MRTKLTCWVDKKRMVPVYGLKVFVKGIWANVAENGEPLLFDDQKDAEAERAVFRKRKAAA